MRYANVNLNAKFSFCWLNKGYLFLRPPRFQIVYIESESTTLAQKLYVWPKNVFPLTPTLLTPTLTLTLILNLTLKHNTIMFSDWRNVVIFRARVQIIVVSPPPRRWGDFYIFHFFQKYAFSSILWSKFLLKTRFSMTSKSVLMRPQSLRPGARAPTWPSCYDTVHICHKGSVLTNR